MPLSAPGTAPPTPATGPLVSVCVPTHNDGAYLAQSLESILRQSYTHLEVLVGDDASTDGTREIVGAIADSRLRYIRNAENLGQFANVNQLVRRARGDFVAIYHSDDVYEPAIVEREVAFLQAHPEAGAVFALDRWIDAQGRVFGRTPVPPPLQAVDCLDLAEAMRVLMRSRNIVFRTPSFMIRAEVFPTVGYFNTTDFVIAGDLEMWLRILTRYRIGILREYLWQYRVSRTQVSARYNYLRTGEDDFFDVMDRFIDRASARADIGREALIQYAFHRAADRTTRAANWVIRGNAAEAAALLRAPFPWAALRSGLGWRKVRVVLLRALMRGGLVVGAAGVLSRLLAWTEYGRRGVVVGKR